MKRIVARVLAGTLCALLAVCVLAPMALAAQGGRYRLDLTQEELAFIQSAGTLKVGYVRDRQPVSFTGENGELAGISRYIFDKVSRLSGLKFDYVALPTGAVTYDYLNSEGFDLVTSVESNRENQQARGILVSQPYLSSRKVVVGRQDLDFSMDRHLSVALYSGSQTIKKVLGDMYPNFTLVDYDSNEACFNAVKSGEADLLIQNQYVVEYWFSKPRYDDLKVIPVVGLDEQLCFSAVVAFGGGPGPSQEDGEILIAILDKAIGAITEDEIGSYTIQGIMENQYEQTFGDFVYRYRHFMLVLALSAAIIIALAVLLVNSRMRSIEARSDARARGQFLSTMSHEIRTPLNGLIGLNYLIGQSLDDRDRISGYLQQSTATAKYLLRLVNNILDMSKLQEHRVDIVSEPLDLELLVTSTANLARIGMEEKGLRFTTECAISSPWIVGDAARIEQVLMNLLDNARKFTPEGGRVGLRIWQGDRDGGKVVTAMEVSDTGRGMSGDFQKHVFDSFARELDTVSKGNQGAGLGLAISYELVKAMDGELSVESEKGEGSKFLFVFPASVARPQTPEAPEPPVSPTGHRQVLVAEDNDLNREIMYDLLDSEGYEVVLAVDGKEAVEKFKASAPGQIGAVLMDLLMPVMDGYEAARSIRALPRPDAGSVHIIACTANTFPEDRKRASDAGMDGFLPKPVDLNDLLNTLKDI